MTWSNAVVLCMELGIIKTQNKTNENRQHHELDKLNQKRVEAVNLLFYVKFIVMSSLICCTYFFNIDFDILYLDCLEKFLLITLT